MRPGPPRWCRPLESVTGSLVRRPRAFIINRVAYIESFARRAMRAGVEYHLGPRVTNIDVSASGVAVTTACGTRRHQHGAEAIIVASGFGSPLLDMVGLGDGRGTDFIVGAQAEVSACGLEDTEVYLGDHIAPGSFGWLVPISDGRALVGLISRRRLNGHLERFIAHLRSSGKVGDVVKEPRRWGIPLRPLPRTYGDRVLIVGDAAGLVKPTTGGGIYYALRSGELAAQKINDAFVAGDLSRRQLKHYQRGWRSLFGRELSVGYCARTLYEALGDSQIEGLLNAFASRGVHEELIDSPEFSFDWQSDVILKAVRLRYLGGVIHSFGPMVAPLLARLWRTANRPEGILRLACRSPGRRVEEKRASV